MPYSALLNLALRRRVPVLQQSEAGECGLACLAMLACYHGMSTNVLTLRQRFGLSLHGCTVATLTGIGRELGMASRVLSLELEELGNLTLPCIIHWNFNHFVVLTHVRPGSITIHDPACGRKRITLKEASKSFTGVALELWPETTFPPPATPLRIRILDLLRNIRGFKGVLVKLFLLSLIVEFIGLLFPMVTQLVMDHIIPERDSSTLSLICLALLLMTMLQGGILLWRYWATLQVNALTDLQWKDGLFRHMLRLPLDWFEKRKLGDIQSRYFSIDIIREAFIHEITGGVIGLIICAGSLTMLVLYGGTLAGVALGFTLIYIILRLTTWPLYRRLSEEQLIKSANADSYLTETLFSINTLRAQGLAEIRSRTMLNLNALTTNAGIRIGKFDMAFSIAATLIGGSESILILWLGVSMVLENQMTLGAWVAFGAFRTMFSDSALGLTNTLLQLRILSLHNERVSDIALSPPENTGSAPVNYPPGKALSLHAENLTYRYDRFCAPVLDSVSLQVKAGESVAITGASGCGKSTLLKLLSGLTPPDSGIILVDGRDIHRSDLASYRCAIASILQHDRLLSGALRDNICGFSQQPDEEWMMDCARLCYIHDDIMALPMGYETQVGELGEGLSGGQLQRLFIARALYRRPGILFMDEATSHLDEHNEQLINQAIAGLAITRIIVAHRPSTIASAQRVIML
jgi:ATP-binding cassette subfamily B protein RaxB